MIETTVNGVMLNDSIAKRLSDLQNGNAKLIAGFLDDSISFLLGNSQNFCGAERELLDVLSSINLVRTELLGLIPGKEGGNK